VEQLGKQILTVWPHLASLGSHEIRDNVPIHGMHIHKPHCSFYKGLPPTRHTCCHLRLTLWLLPIRHLTTATTDGPQFGDGPQKNSLHPASHFSVRYGSRDGSVGIVTGLRTGRSGLRITEGAERQNRLWGPPSLLFKAYRDSSLGVRRLGCDIAHLPSCSTEVRNEWSYTSTSPVYLYGVDKGNIYLISVHKIDGPYCV
jgi:hypothetical protein